MAPTEPKPFDMETATLEDWNAFRSTFECDLYYNSNLYYKKQGEKIDELLLRMGKSGREMFNNFPHTVKPRNLEAVLEMFETYFTKKHKAIVHVLDDVHAKVNGGASTSICVTQLTNLSSSELKPFDTENGTLEDWKEFRSTFERYVDSPSCNNRTEEGKVALFLSLIGEPGTELYLRFSSSGNRRTWKLNRVMGMFEAHFMEKESVIEDRERFYGTRQLEGETFNNFLARVEESASKCDFGNQTCIDQMVRDRVVLGIRDKQLKRNFLKMKDVSLKKAVIFCRRAEQCNESLDDEPIITLESLRWRPTKYNLRKS